MIAFAIGLSVFIFGLWLKNSSNAYSAKSSSSSINIVSIQGDNNTVIQDGRKVTGEEFDFDNSEIDEDELV